MILEYIKHGAEREIRDSTGSMAAAKGEAASGSTLALEGALKLMARTKAKITVAVGVCLLFAAATTKVIVKGVRPYDPVYQGKPVSYWFDLSLNNPLMDRPTAFNPFYEIEGDAVPYLSSCVNAHPTAFDKAYEYTYSHLPPTLARKLPPPRKDDYYVPRRNISLSLLGMIGTAQLWKSELGEPSSKPSITLALPTLGTMLAEPDILLAGGDAFSGQSRAAETLGIIGPPAAQAIPALIKLARSTNEGAWWAIEALGSIGPSASNAVSLLVQIADDQEMDSVGIPIQLASDPSKLELWTQKVSAVRALGRIGLAGRAAAPTLSSLLTDSDGKLRGAAVHSLACVGSTPDEAIPALLVIKRGTNEIDAGFATLALWNHDREDSKLSAEVAAELFQSPSYLLPAVAILGTDAVRFLPEVSQLVNHGDTNIQREARIALRKIRTVVR